MSYTIVVPDQQDVFTNVFMMALTIYREAEGETPLGKLAVGYTIVNRVAAKSWFGHDIYGVVTKPSQYSCYNKGDNRSVVFGPPNNPAWRESMQAAVDVIQNNRHDPTDGSTHYHTVSMNPYPEWSKTAQLKVRIDNHLFYIAK